MLIAHGSPVQLLKEQVLNLNQYESIISSNHTKAGGGVTADEWMSLFGLSLRLSTLPLEEVKIIMQDAQSNDYKKLDNTGSHGKTKGAGGKNGGNTPPTFKHRFSNSQRHVSPERRKSLVRLDYARKRLTRDDMKALSTQDTLHIYRQLVGEYRFSIILDVKSKFATPDLLISIMKHLNASGIHVAAMGTFIFSQVKGIDKVTQNIATRNNITMDTFQLTLPPPRALKFFHFAGDLQQACRKGLLSEGDTVLFNGGSLISINSMFGSSQIKMSSYSIMEDVVGALDRYKKRHKLSIGIYVQEPDIDYQATNILVNMVNSQSHIFDFGLAWGGLIGSVPGDILATRTNASVGKASQKFVGKKWNRRGSTIDETISKDIELMSCKEQLNAMSVRLSELEKRLSYKDQVIVDLQHLLDSNHIAYEKKCVIVDDGDDGDDVKNVVPNVVRLEVRPSVHNNSHHERSTTPAQESDTDGEGEGDKSSVASDASDDIVETYVGM